MSKPKVSSLAGGGFIPHTHGSNARLDALAGEPMKTRGSY